MALLPLLLAAEPVQTPETMSLLDLGSSEMRCLVLGVDEVAAQAHAIGSNLPAEMLGYDRRASVGIKCGAVDSLERANACVRMVVERAERMAGFRIDDLFVTFGGGNQESSSFRVRIKLGGGQVRAEHIADGLDRVRGRLADDLRRVMHLNVFGYAIDDGPIQSDPIGLPGEALIIHGNAVTVDRTALEHLDILLEKSFLPRARVLPAAYASALGVLHAQEVRDGVLCVDFGAQLTSVAAFGEGQLIGLKTWPSGGAHLTGLLARRLSTSFEDAERIKNLYGTAMPTPADDAAEVSFVPLGATQLDQPSYTSRGEIADLMSPQLDVLLERLDACLNEWQLREVASSVVLTGGGSQLMGLDELVHRALEVPVRVAAPTACAGMPIEIAQAHAAAVIGAGHGVLLAAKERLPVRTAPLIASSSTVAGRLMHWFRDSFWDDDAELVQR